MKCWLKFFVMGILQYVSCKIPIEKTYSLVADIRWGASVHKMFPTRENCRESDL